MEITFELGYALNTFYFLICGAFVMWMAAGFTMLEAGLVRVKNTTEILTKNMALYAVASIMYMVCGYSIMYGGDDFSFFIQDISANGVTGAKEPVNHAPAADFFFQVVFVATAMSIVSGAVAERMKLWAFLAFSVVLTGFIYPMEGSWTWGEQKVLGMFALADLGFSDFAGSGIVHLAGASAALAGVLVLGARSGKYSKQGKAKCNPRRKFTTCHPRHFYSLDGMVWLQRRFGAGNFYNRKCKLSGRRIYEYQHGSSRWIGGCAFACTFFVWKSRPNYGT